MLDYVLLLTLSLLALHCRYSRLSSTLSDSPGLLLSAQQALLQYIYKAHLSTVHLDDSELELSLTHSTQVPRTQLVEEELILTPLHGTGTQPEDSS